MCLHMRNLFAIDAICKDILTIITTNPFVLYIYILYMKDTRWVKKNQSLGSLGSLGRDYSSLEASKVLKDRNNITKSLNNSNEGNQLATSGVRELLFQFNQKYIHLILVL